MKNLKNFTGVKSLSKNEQKDIKGGTLDVTEGGCPAPYYIWWEGSCYWHKSKLLPVFPY